MAPKRRTMMIKLPLRPPIPPGAVGAVSARKDRNECGFCIMNFVLN